MGLVWETYEKVGMNPKTGEQVIAERRRIQHVLDLPKKDEYGAFVARQIAAA